MLRSLSFRCSVPLLRFKLRFRCQTALKQPHWQQYQHTQRTTPWPTTGRVMAAGAFTCSCYTLTPSSPSRSALGSRAIIIVAQCARQNTTCCTLHNRPSTSAPPRPDTQPTVDDYFFIQPADHGVPRDANLRACNLSRLCNSAHGALARGAPAAPARVAMQGMQPLPLR